MWINPTYPIYNWGYNPLTNWDISVFVGKTESSWQNQILDPAQWWRVTALGDTKPISDQKQTVCWDLLVRRAMRSAKPLSNSAVRLAWPRINRAVWRDFMRLPRQLEKNEQTAAMDPMDPDARLGS